MISNENQHQMKMDYIYESKKDFRKGETKNSPNLSVQGKM